MKQEEKDEERKEKKEGFSFESLLIYKAQEHYLQFVFGNLALNTDRGSQSSLS